MAQLVSKQLIFLHPMRILWCFSPKMHFWLILVRSKNWFQFWMIHQLELLMVGNCRMLMPHP